MFKPDRNFNLGGKKDGEGNISKTTVHRGDKVALLKYRQTERSTLIPEIEKILDKWDGGGLAIVYNNHDENDEVPGAHICIIGSEGVTGLLMLAKAVHDTADKIIEQTVKGVSKEGPEGLIALMKATAEIMGTETQEEKEE